MRTRIERLGKLLTPTSIAFVGGSALEPAIRYTRKLGFRGHIHIINPSREELSSVPCVRSAADIEGEIDLAFVAVPAHAASDALQDLSSAGANAAIISAAGFSELGEAGQVLEGELLQAAGDMPFLGPNCPGMVNFLDGIGCMLDDLGRIDNDRGVAIISNGGAFLADVTCSDRSLPVSYIMGMGNQASVSVAEMIEVVLDDPRVSAIGLYLERLPDIHTLTCSARKSIDKAIPIVALKGGRSDSGGRATQSHTASMAGDDVIASALFRKLGIVEVNTVSEILETLKLISLAKPFCGSRVAFTTSSGTYAVCGSDALEQQNFQLPPLEVDHQAAVQEHLSPFLVANNPLDIATGQFDAEERQQAAFSALLKADFDLAIQCMSFPAENTWEDESWYRSASVFANVAIRQGIQPIFLSPTQEGLPRRAREMLIALGSVPLQGYTDGCLALAHSRDWWRRLASLQADGVPDLLPSRPVRGSARQLDEREAKAILGGQDISVPAGLIWRVDDPMPSDIVYPVVLKLLEPAVAHKTELGAVQPGIESARELEAARERMLTSLAGQGIVASALLVERQVAGGIAEMLVGIRRSPEAGMTLTLSMGGTLVELLADSRTLILPVSESEIRDAIKSLRLYPLLTGWRGSAVADLPALIETILKLSRIASSDWNSLVELEINPLLVRSGQPPIALDAVMTIED